MMHSGEIIGAGWRIVTGGGTAFIGINRTGADSIRGTVVTQGPERGVVVFPGDDTHAGGVVYEDGISDGEPMWVVTFGPARVLLKDGTGATEADWLKTSDVAGRTEAAPKPTALGIPELYDHFRMAGFVIDTIEAGTDVLCLAFIRFN